MLIAGTVKPGLYIRYIFSMEGISARQGRHQVAQDLQRSLPRNSEGVYASPKGLSVKSGAAFLRHECYLLRRLVFAEYDQDA
jgi:hypothetical protein